MSLFEVKPYDREVYEKELKDFLPQKILDVHTHVYLKEFFRRSPSPRARSSARSPGRALWRRTIPLRICRRPTG